MNHEERQLHLGKWADRIQDAIDGALDAKQSAELRAHFAQCALCRDFHAGLLAVHSRLAHELSQARPLSKDFSTRVLALVDEHEKASRSLAKQRAEAEFRERITAFKFDWREFWQRHLGNLIAAATVFGASVAAMNSLWPSAREQVRVALSGLPFASNPVALPIGIAIIATAIASTTLWWLRTRTR